MQLDVTRAIQSPGTEFPFDLFEEHGAEQWNGDDMSFTSPLHFTGVFFCSEESVFVSGHVSTTVRVPCAACLEPADQPVLAQVNEQFVRAGVAQEEHFAYEGHTLQLDELVMGALYMNLPMRILCHAGCKGICPQCYVNLNHTQCSCQKDSPEKHPFAALASLLNQDEEV